MPSLIHWPRTEEGVVLGKEIGRIELKKRPFYAGGVGAIVSTLKHVLTKGGMKRATSSLIKLNQKDGVDCPGCAWPDPDDERSVAEFCENGAKAVAHETTQKRLGKAFFERFSVNELAKKSDYWLEQMGRLTTPLYLAPGKAHYRPISYGEAFERVANHLNALESPDEALFYTSGRTSNEAAFVYQLMVRLFGTNNLPDCSNMCHESSGVALSESMGVGKGSVTVEDFEHAQVIVIFGQNPGTNHPRMLSTLQKAKQKGAKIIVVNPLCELGTEYFIHPQDVSAWGGGDGERLSDIFLQIKINGDVALIKGLIKGIVELNSGIDRDFIDQYTAGFEDFLADIEATSWEQIENGCGLGKDCLEETIECLSSSERIIACWGMGLTQHENAVGNIQTLMNLLYLKGSIGKKGAGACPVRGHSNVQGDRTMGITEKPSPGFLQALAREFDFEPPKNEGLEVVGAIQAMHQKKAHVFVGLGGNFMAATPDTHFTAKALAQTKLSVQISTKLNRSHVITGKEAIIFPCKARSEKDQAMSVENSMGIVHATRGHLDPVDDNLKSEVEIVCALALKLFEHSKLKGPKVNWRVLMADYGQIRGHIERVIPGFKDYNQRFDRDFGFYLPHPVRDDRQFPTPNGKANFLVHPIANWDLPEGKFLMMTIRSHDQYNTTIYGLEDRYRGISNGRKVVLTNPKDLSKLNIQSGQKVDIVNDSGEVKRVAKDFVAIAYDIPPGQVATYFPEGNVLVPVDSFAHKSKTPCSKSVVVHFE